MKKIFTTFLIALMLFLLCACHAEKTETVSEQPVQEQESAVEHIDYSIKYHLKINPEFTLCADDNLCVTEISAENDDAKAVLASVNVIGLTVNEAFALITTEATAQGYITSEKGNTIDITILEKDDEKMPTCHICGGCGTIICLDCNGTGVCCDCERCGSTGIIHFEAGPQCPHCDGSGLCADCNGVGKIVVTNGEDGSIVYVSEGVPEMGECPGCIGDGVCENCHGGEYSTSSHDEECEGCRGTGKIYCQDDLNGYRWCPCCWGSGVDGTGDPNYEEWMKENGY